jgi:hypothetical protein
MSVIGNTPIIVSKDKKYIEVHTIEDLSKMEKGFFVWTPNGWDEVLNITTEMLTEDNVPNLRLINDGKNFLICDKDVNILSHTFMTFNDFQNSVVILKLVPELIKLVYEYCIPTVDLEYKNNFYWQPFPISNVIDIKMLITDDGNNYNCGSHPNGCQKCEEYISGNFYVCPECSKYYNMKDGVWYTLCSSCYKTCKEFEPVHIFDNELEMHTIQHNESHQMKYILVPRRTDYYNATDTSYLEKQIFDSILSFFDDRRERVTPYFNITLNRNNHLFNTYYTHQCLISIMEYEKLGYTNYSFNMANNCNTLQKNFYIDIIKKHKDNPLCRKIIKKHQNPNKKWKFSKGCTLYYFTLESDFRGKYIYQDINSTYKNRDNMILFPITMYSLITKSGFWHAGIGKLIIYNKNNDLPIDDE